MKLLRYKSRNMYIGEERGIRPVFSYDTLIGYLDDFLGNFYTWGYGVYSRTTSKQITQLAHETGYRLVKCTEQEAYEIARKTAEAYDKYL